MVVVVVVVVVVVKHTQKKQIIGITQPWVLPNLGR